jgi:hypothetical protein
MQQKFDLLTLASGEREFSRGTKPHNVLVGLPHNQ